MRLDALTVASAVLGVALFLGAWLAFTRRRIDHRWYCGEQHRANLRCQPSQQYVDEWRQREKFH